jgi:anaerobic selenocysteine-containing dehydrogenase
MTNVVIGRQHDERDGTPIHLRTCPLCECMCGLEMHLNDDRRVQLIRPFRDDVFSKGYICPKGTTLGRIHDDPDRLRVPLIREGESFREATWPEAFARCHELIAGVLERHGLPAFTAFVGNPVGHSFSLGRYGALLFRKMAHIYSAGTVDQWPKNVTCALMYGNQWKIPTADITRTDYLVVMGGNPAASGGSLMACPDVLGEIDGIRARGGQVVVIDPRRTGTADKADHWIPIVPGTDAAFLLAVCHVVFAEGLDRLGAVDGKVNGIDAVRRAADDFTPESVEAFCGVPAHTTRTVARDLAGRERAVLYGRIGLCNQEFGTLASWLVDVVNIITGNFDTVGGMMFGNPVGAPMAWAVNADVTGWATFGRWRSRVRNAPEVLGQFPASCLAEEIIEPGDGQIRGLFTVAGNPALSVPDSARLEAALPELECMIAVENYLNETSRFAHVILPGVSPLESPHLDDLMWGWASRSAIKWSDALYALDDGRPEEWEILARLGHYLTGGTDDDFDIAKLDDEWFTMICRMHRLDPVETMARYDHGGPERMIDVAIRMGPWGDRFGERPDGITLADVKAAPEGLDFGPMVPRVDELVRTPTGKIELAPDYITDDVPRLRRRMAERAPGGLVLVSRRHMRSKNTWLHNIDVLVSGKGRCTLLMHPDDAASRRVSTGDRVLVTSEAGAIEMPVEVTDEMMAGVVCLPHGWGHDRPGTRLSVAREHAGVNSNLLAPGAFVDVPSGNAAVNGIPVEVVAVSV